eukprot:TRINITY_DN827_c0_g1_i1.p1 TRINITY_DN827_c0_g1~~TRINITY_DN827_c0_g1_i1.p1  ORF type:complete len:702 (+),score=122.42 TRINITY_DN827_c0_g1_i1:3-2108(+)
MKGAVTTTTATATTSLPPTLEYVEKLVNASLLTQAQKLASSVSAKRATTHRPYSRPQPTEVIEKAGVWFTSYPPSTITTESVLKCYGSEQLWDIFAKIGIQALHTGPMKCAGSLDPVTLEHKETCDGYFDRISFDIDPIFGTDDDYTSMVEAAAKRGAIIAGDLVPGHTGKGADYLLALLNYGQYPGMYCMYEVEEKDWEHLPVVPEGVDSVNLSFSEAEWFVRADYLPGLPQRVLFSVPGEAPKTAFDCTGEVVGADGVTRRWIYLHFFKPGQPTLNWLDPSYASSQVQAGDVISCMNRGVKMVRLDANPFLGIERTSDGLNAHSEGTPLSVAASNSIAWMIRKLGGWSFQELNLSLDDIAEFARGGADLSYDFITRPAYLHAILTGDASFLNLMTEEMQRYNVEPQTLIHALQNHDEITYELVHFLKHSDRDFKYRGKLVSGKNVRDSVLEEMESRVRAGGLGDAKSGNGVCTTFVSFICAALSLPSSQSLSTDQISKVSRGHLILAFYNCLQPGVFALSAWDLLGVANLDPAQVKKWTDIDGDLRWLNRGSFDLLDSEGLGESALGVPKGISLYGSLSSQLSSPSSFLSKLTLLINYRQESGVGSGRLDRTFVSNNGALFHSHFLLEDGTHLYTVINFSLQSVVAKLGFGVDGDFSSRNVSLCYSTDPTVTLQESEDGSSSVALPAWTAISYSFTPAD